MAKEKSKAVEREYIINLRREILKVPKYRRTPKAIKAVKQFIAKHMRVPERDVDKVKLSKWVNQELWYRGIQNPPTKIKVKVRKEGENVIVDLVDIHENVKFAMAREEKAKAHSEKAKEKKKSEKETEKPTEESEKEKTEEKEKEESVKEAEIKATELMAKEQKHIAKVKPAKSERMNRKNLEK
ncbi:MAG: 50S ribosomal protein L31e [Candidatus Pacearchaeota archaeon]|jgi:large subunit ribosomal protein L31e